ncbi:MAG: hypothetical protein ABSB36_07890, partial [Candidatus Dormibacteria bacterium]
PRWSSTSRTARSRTSWGYLLVLAIAPSSQGMEPPGFPGRFTARLLGLPLLDHIILTARSHFSFREV